MCFRKAAFAWLALAPSILSYVPHSGQRILVNLEDEPRAFGLGALFFLLCFAVRPERSINVGFRPKIVSISGAPAFGLGALFFLRCFGVSPERSINVGFRPKIVSISGAPAIVTCSGS